MAPITGGLLILRHALGILSTRDLRRRGFAEHREDELKVCHVIAQVFALQTFEPLVLRRRQAEGGFGDFGGENSVVALLGDAALLPFAVSSSRTAMPWTRFSIQSTGWP